MTLFTHILDASLYSTIYLLELCKKPSSLTCQNNFRTATAPNIGAIVQHHYPPKLSRFESLDQIIKVYFRDLHLYPLDLFSFPQFSPVCLALPRLDAIRRGADGNINFRHLANVNTKKPGVNHFRSFML